MRSAGVPFSVVPAAVAESDDDTLGLTTLVATNARAKALEVAARYPDAVVLGADTLVWLGGRALGKPADHNEARRMLRELSGQTHEVATAVHLVRMEPRQQVEFHEITRVRFRPLGEDVIEEYLATVDVLDKAGAYALQENGEMLVESVEGSRSNVVGLPLERTMATLAQNFGW